MTTSPAPAGAVHAYQTDAPGAYPTWSGSPVSRVASTVVPLVSPYPEMAWAFAKSSFEGGAACAAGSGTATIPTDATSVVKTVRRAAFVPDELTTDPYGLSRM